MIYLDTSVALAWMFGETRHPPEDLWDRPLASSRLLEYELWARLHARQAPPKDWGAADDLVARLLLVELVPPVVARARAGFGMPVRTLDAMHLSTALYLAEHRQGVTLASYDDRLVQAAAQVGVPLAPQIG